MRDSEMANCPTCGARLAKKLVEDIANPTQIETCPNARRSAKIAAKRQASDSVLDSNW